jgi:outer membrane protein assembly factor BamB
VTAFDRETGQEEWSYSLPEKMMRTVSLAFGNGVLYVEAGPRPGRGEAPFKLVALNSADGKALFALSQSDPLSPVAIKDDVNIASSHSGVVAFDAKTGDEKWREEISLISEPGRARLTTQMDLDTAPVIVGDTMLVPTRGSTPERPWRQATGDFFDVTLGLAAFDLKAHQQIWFFRPRGAGTNASVRGVQFENGKIVAAVTGGTRNSYLGVDPATGKLDWLIPLETQADRNHEVIHPLFSNGVLYLVKDEKLFAVPLFVPGKFKGKVMATPMEGN